ncbi:MULTISPECIES: hypothetical protein [Streptomyces]|uniref:M24 family metallopeptidase n=1 Tax=Streptomyces galilaeus TaxID=33899 RepID=A0ABW9IVX7_STRGJ
MPDHITLRDVELPPLSVLEPEPVLSGEVYAGRIDRTRARMREMGLTHLIAYADREHPGNSLYLTGFDPRFEEALVVLDLDNAPWILAGNESSAMVPGLPVTATAVLCQSLSLPGQDRSIQQRVSAALRQVGVGSGARVGLVGWRQITAGDSPLSPYAYAVPAFVIGEILDVTPNLTDATSILMGIDGLRSRNEADQIALNEHRSTRAAGHAWRALEALEPGRSELATAEHMALNGLPLTAHVMLTTGSGKIVGLCSPSDRVIGHGDLLSTAAGLQGGLTSRAGYVLHAGQLDQRQTDFAAGYFAAIAIWYQGLVLGASTAEIAERTTRELAKSSIRPLLNPGHLQHIDEWLDSPFAAGSHGTVHSGMSLQADIIPVGSTPDLAANCEDAVAIADADLRAELAERYPRMWARVTARRTFMTQTLGLRIAEEVLPLSDRQAVLPPALLSLSSVLVATASA